jgi:membrane protein DedA with SNARE-associated domain
VLWFTAFIENVFPPSPSDVLILFIATLIGIGTIGHIESIAIATLGSVMGFLTAFLLGRQFGRRWVDTGRVPFASKGAIERVEQWFKKYGYWVIVANRFLSGTRAVISFFAGMSDLDLAKTTLLCGVSALAWNILLIELGRLLGRNWHRGIGILRRYETAVTIVLAAVVLFFVIRWLLKKKAAPQSTSESSSDTSS